ncbi:heterokaryon incompatibility protein-domain-containing protein [Phaeosphaeria sp. MPI-PUGE-AT-0046c]|nr:heterokaryon incompatibility protein-domain-containing protein [Phaeosphaeria sp. MPI-PUGE-AT-0046c]
MASTQVDTGCASTFYQHQLLDNNKRQFRLLRLCNSSECAMNYQLITSSLENHPPYVALSYTWGEETSTGSINIDGKKFKIGTNLLSFLDTYHADEYLWIDQICIDQSNIEERNHQVGMMWEFYIQCKFVLVWLQDEKTRNDDEKSSGWPTIALLHNAYFGRVWIVQELLLSKDVHILVEGNVSVSWESLRKKCEELRPEIRKALPSSTRWMVESWYHRRLFASHTPVSSTYYVTTTVGWFCDKKCKEPRDKVYGFMALVQPSSRVDIDYQRAVQEIFLDAVMSMIREYWHMRHVTPSDGYELQRVKWNFKESIDSSWRLAQNMSFTNLETSGLRSFVQCIWERVLRYEVTGSSGNPRLNTKTHCITSVGFEPSGRRLSRDEQLKATHDRWWYETGGRRYYHDCKEWSGKAKTQEYLA